MLVSGGISPFWAGTDIATQRRVVRAKSTINVNVLIWLLVFLLHRTICLRITWIEKSQTSPILKIFHYKVLHNCAHIICPVISHHPLLYQFHIFRHEASTALTTMHLMWSPTAPKNWSKSEDAQSLPNNVESMKRPTQPTSVILHLCNYVHPHFLISSLELLETTSNAESSRLYWPRAWIYGIDTLLMKHNGSYHVCTVVCNAIFWGSLGKGFRSFNPYNSYAK